MRVLVADDQAGVLEAAKFLLKSEGYSAVTADSPQAVLRLTSREDFDLILMDLNYARDTTSGAEGLDLLQSLRSTGVRAPVVVMTAWGSVDLAVEAMRRGASDFVQKPWDNTRLLETIHKQVAKSRSDCSDLDIAREVQAKLLPRTAPQIAGFEIFRKLRTGARNRWRFLRLVRIERGPVRVHARGCFGKGYRRGPPDG